MSCQSRHSESSSEHLEADLSGGAGLLPERQLWSLTVASLIKPTIHAAAGFQGEKFLPLLLRLVHDHCDGWRSSLDGGGFGRFPTAVTTHLGGEVNPSLIPNVVEPLDHYGH